MITVNVYTKGLGFEIWRFHIDFGWYWGESFTLAEVILLDVDEWEITLCCIKVAKLILSLGFNCEKRVSKRDN